MVSHFNLKPFQCTPPLQEPQHVYLLAAHCVHNVDKTTWRLHAPGSPGFLGSPGSPAWKAEECMLVYWSKKLMDLLGMTQICSKETVHFVHLGLELKQGSQCAPLNQSPTPSSDCNPRRLDQNVVSDLGFLRPHRLQQPFSTDAHFAELLHDCVRKF